MKFEILVEKLKEGLRIIEKAIAKSTTLPILNNVLLTTEKNFLRLSATDLEIGINWRGLAKIEKEGEMAIPAKLLLHYINYIPEKRIVLEKKDQILFIDSQKSQTQIKGFSSEDFPIIPKVSREKMILVDNQTFCQALSQVVDFATPSTTRPEISGILFQLTKENLVLTATDSFRLAEKKIFLEKPSSEQINFIIPQRSARDIINIFGELKGDLKIYFDPNHILFEIDMTETPQPHIQFFSRLIEGSFPDYQAIIPQKYNTQVILLKDDFLKQIKLASLFSGKINEVKLKINPRVQEVEIFSQNPDIGNYSATISGKIKGEMLGISFNHRFLVEGLEKIKGPEVIFELNKEKQPGLLKPSSDQTYLYILMPIESS